MRPALSPIFLVRALLFLFVSVAAPFRAGALADTAPGELFAAKAKTGRSIAIELLVDGTPDQIFENWVTADGVRQFFGSGSNIERAAASVIRMRYSAGIIGLTAVVLSAVGTSSENGPIRSAVAEGQEPEYAEIMGPISAPIAEVWKAFTTSDGLSSFYAPGAFVEPKVGGLFELYLFPDNPVGQRGLEGLRILAFEPERRLMIAWKAPAYVREEIGSQHTIQEISFTASGPEETIVRIRQFGFGDTAAWAGAKRYFELRGRDVHMNLKERFDHGSLDWEEAMERFWRTSELIDRY